jgi:hypothetical protein
MRKIIIWCALVVMAVFVGSCEDNPFRPADPTYEDLSNVLYYDMTVTVTTFAVIVKRNSFMSLSNVILRIDGQALPLTYLQHLGAAFKVFMPDQTYSLEVEYDGNTYRGSVKMPPFPNVAYPQTYSPSANLELNWDATTYKFQKVEVSSFEFSLSPNPTALLQSILEEQPYEKVIPPTDRRHIIPPLATKFQSESSYFVNVISGNFVTDKKVAFITESKGLTKVYPQ